MSAIPTEYSEPVNSFSPASRGARAALAWSGFLFALLQSICGAAVLLNGIQLAIGIGALTFTSGIGLFMARFHEDWIRVPMIILALLATLANIALLLRLRSLRNRPAAQWRRKVRTRRQVRVEVLQWTLSIAALVLIGIEEYLHMGFHHTL